MADYKGDPRQAPAGTVVQMWGGVDPVYAEGNGKFYQQKNGRKTYVPAFVVMQGYHPGTEVDASGQLTPEAQKERSAQNVPGASLFHGRGEFSPETGDYEQGWNWGNIISMVVAGALTAGMADIIMSAPAGTAAAAAESGILPTEAVATGAATGAEAAGIPVAGSSLAATVPAITAPVASGAATGAEGAGIPVAGPQGFAVGSTTAGGTGTLDAAGNWIPDAGTDATTAGADASSTPDWLKTARDIGQTATDISSGRAKGRVDESNINNSADRNLIDLYRTQVDASTGENNYGLNSALQANNYGLGSVNANVGIGNLDIAQKNYALDAPGKRAGNSVRGDILANAQDVSIDGPSTIPKTTISGGLRPSMFSGNTRELGGLLSSQALSQQKAGDTFAPLPSVPAFTPPPPYKPPPAAPTLTGPSQANGVDAGLNGAGYFGLGADLLAKYGKFFK